MAVNGLERLPEPVSMTVTLDLEIDRGGAKAIVKVFPQKFENQKNYYFVWSDDIKDFMYSDPVGTFMWNPDTDEITRFDRQVYCC